MANPGPGSGPQFECAARIALTRAGSWLGQKKKKKKQGNLKPSYEREKKHSWLHSILPENAKKMFIVQPALTLAVSWSFAKSTTG